MTTNPDSGAAGKVCLPFQFFLVYQHNNSIWFNSILQLIATIHTEIKILQNSLTYLIVLVPFIWLKALCLAVFTASKLFYSCQDHPASSLSNYLKCSLVHLIIFFSTILFFLYTLYNILPVFLTVCSKQSLVCTSLIYSLCGFH